MSARTSALDGIHGKLGLWRKTGVKQTRTALEGHTAPSGSYFSRLRISHFLVFEMVPTPSPTSSRGNLHWLGDASGLRRERDNQDSVHPGP